MTCSDCNDTGRLVVVMPDFHEVGGSFQTFDSLTEAACDCTPYVGLPPEDHAARMAADPEYVPV